MLLWVTMSYYQITVNTKSGKVYKGVRYDYTDDIDLMWMKCKTTALDKFKEDFADIDVVMISTFSKTLREHQAKFRSEHQAKIKINN